MDFGVEREHESIREAIERICAHLEHMPLAIEIAAGHLRRLSLADIAAGVTNPLDLGASGLRHSTTAEQQGGHHSGSVSGHAARGGQTPLLRR